MQIYNPTYVCKSNSHFENNVFPIIFICKCLFTILLARYSSKNRNLKHTQISHIHTITTLLNNTRIVGIKIKVQFMSYTDIQTLLTTCSYSYIESIHITSIPITWQDV